MSTAGTAAIACEKTPGLTPKGACGGKTHTTSGYGGSSWLMK